MSRWRLILRSLRHHWRVNVALVLGVAAATVVLCGALAVGDSMRRSLADLTLERLGRTDQVVLADRFFRAELAAELQGRPDFGRHFALALPAVLLEGTVQNPDDPQQPRAGRVTVLGTRERFRELNLPSPAPWAWPDDDQIVLNEPLAERIHAKEGSEVVLRLGQASDIPADNPLGSKSDTVRSGRLKVRAVVPAHGLGRFSLRPNQQKPLCAFLSLGTLQSLLDQPGRANAILVAGSRLDGLPDPHDPPDLVRHKLRPTLDDYSLALLDTGRGYFSLASRRMLIEPAAEAALLRDLAPLRPQPTLTYLANWIAAGGRRGRIPYSTVTALDPARDPPLGPLLAPDGKPIESLGDEEILLNSWAVKDLADQGVKLAAGDPIELTFFEPESTHGRVQERTATFRLRSEVQLAGAAADPHLTPEVAGVTDQKSIANWDPPFPFDQSRVRVRPPNDIDDAYWKQHRATPKAFVSLAAGRRLWGSRFGQTTAIRIRAAGTTANDIEGRLTLDPTENGFQFLAVKRDGLAASTGTTPFNLLFLGFSSFIIASAVMLVVLMARLSVEQRSAEIGTLLGVGLRRRTVAALLAGEGAVVALAGGVLGAWAGVGYAWLMLTGLNTWWVAAIGEPFLKLHVTPLSIAIGLASGAGISLLAIVATVRRVGRVPLTQLLAGQAEPPGFTRPKARRSKRAGWALLIMAAAIGGASLGLGGEARAAAFFGAGAAALAGGLCLVWSKLRTDGGRSRGPLGNFPLAWLALRNAQRRPLRSTLTIGLVAAASFLIVGISAFRLDPESLAAGRASGSGGLALIAESDQPIYHDVNTPKGRAELAFPDDAEKLLAGTEIIALRSQAGDDASCLNLYKPGQPRALGVPRTLADRGGFAWSASIASTPADRENPWRLLWEPLPRDGEVIPVPVVLDANTATYSLHLGLGDQFSIRDGRGRKQPMQIVGLLKNSIFQGDVLLSEQAFREHFPQVSGYRMFLVDVKQQSPDAVAKALEETLGDFGFFAQPTARRLAEFLQVQNTYLSTFQSLGGLGLLLGTLGLAAVQLRNVLERRGELALMRAAGFRRARLALLVLVENGVLLLGGLAIGTAAALLAVAPHLFERAATLPWPSLAAILAGVLLSGLAASFAAVRAVLRADVLAALRGN